MTVRSVGYDDGKVNLWIGDEAIRLTPTEAARLAHDLLAAAFGTAMHHDAYPLGGGE